MQANDTDIAKFSPGDADVVVVNQENLTWKAYGGYFDDRQVSDDVNPDPDSLPLDPR